MLSIQTNVNSMNAQENIRVTNNFQGRTIARLTSGYRINESGDDAAGLAVANMYRSDVAELQQGVRNANDGLSTLQIVDGGLNNISKMLDRLKTLATQSASDTFTGERATLNKEYQDLLTEINRQAGMIGLASTGDKEIRNNYDIGVYVGGSKQGTAKVMIELSGSANRVDSTGLNLVGTSIADGGATVVGDVNLRAAASLPLLKSAVAGTPETQVFTFTLGKDNVAPQTFTVTVTGNDDGITVADALTQLNAGLGSHGITASVDSETGKLAFGGNVAFTVSAAAASNGNPLTGAVATPVANGSMHQVVGDGSFAAAESLNIKIGNVTHTVALLAGDATAAAVAAKINAEVADNGVYAFVSGTEVVLQSNSAFTASSSEATAAGFFAAAAATSLDSAPTNTESATSNAEAAIASIQNAVSALGLVQGKVGTAQNKLTYAISLAQSQITSFSAAESRIRDADVAQEAANLTKAQVLQQASLAALAQANSAPQAVLSLLRG
jgi:flagellin